MVSVQSPTTVPPRDRDRPRRPRSRCRRPAGGVAHPGSAEFRRPKEAQVPWQHGGPPDERQARRPGQAQGRGRRSRHRQVAAAPARPGQAARPRAHRPPARSRVVPRARPAGPPPGRVGLRRPALHRRRHLRLGHGRRPQGLRLLAGLHGVRRRARRGVRRQDPQAHGPGAQGRGPGRRHQRRRRRPHPGGRGQPRQLRRHLLPQRAVVGRDPPDQRDHGARAPAAPSTRPP